MRAVHFRIVWIIVLALLRISGTLLCLCFLALTSVLRLLPPIPESDDSGKRKRHKADDPYDFDTLGAYPGKRPRIY